MCISNSFEMNCANPTLCSAIESDSIWILGLESHQKYLFLQVNSNKTWTVDKFKTVDDKEI